MVPQETELEKTHIIVTYKILNIVDIILFCPRGNVVVQPSVVHNLEDSR